MLTRLTNDEGTVYNTFSSNGGLYVDVKNTAFFSKTQDGSGGSITSSSGSGGKNGLDVNIIGGGSLTNYALETGGNLESVKTNTAGLTNLTFTNTSLNTNISSVSGVIAVSITGTPNVSVSGTVGITGTPTVLVSSGTVGITGIVGVTGSVNILNPFLNTHIQGNDGAGVYNDVLVDANGFLTTNVIEAVHQNIQIGFDGNVTKLTKYNGSSNKTWQNDNPYSKTQNGWYVSGIATTSAQLLWYSNGDYIPFLPTATTTFNTQYNFTFSDIDIFYMIIQNYNCSSTLNFPQIIVMSKPTGTDDVAPYAHSIWIYSINANQFINNGSAVMIYNGNLARVKTNEVESPRISYSLTSTIGDGGVNEIIGHISMETIASGGSTNIIDMNVIEAAVYVKNKGLINYYFTNDRGTEVEFSQTSNQNNIKITDAEGDIATISTPFQLTGTSSIRGLDTQSYVNAYDVYNNEYKNLTCVPSQTNPSNLYRALDTYIRNDITTFNNSIFGASGTTTGINMYSIPVKQKQLVMSGTSATANGILAGGGSTQTIASADWGITKPKIFSIFMTAASVIKTFYYDYIDIFGNERTGTFTPPTVNAWHQLPFQTGFTDNMVGINNVRVSASLLANDVYYIAYNASITNAVATGTFSRSFCGIITIPNNAIGHVSNVTIFNGVASNFNLHKCDAITGARKNIYYYNTPFASNHAPAGFEGALGGILEPGSAIFGANENANSMTVFANVVIKYLS